MHYQTFCPAVSRPVFMNTLSNVRDSIFCSFFYHRLWILITKNHVFASFNSCETDISDELQINAFERLHPFM